MSSVVHDSMTIERTYEAPPKEVFAAWATLEAKSQWWGNLDRLEIREHTMDFRVGGREHLNAKAQGMVFEMEARYVDITDGERIVWTYEMRMDGRPMSASVASVEFTADPVGPAGTRLTLTEQGSYLDGLDNNASRADGHNRFLDHLGDYLAAR